MTGNECFSCALFVSRPASNARNAETVLQEMQGMSEKATAGQVLGQSLDLVDSALHRGGLSRCHLLPLLLTQGRQSEAAMMTDCMWDLEHALALMDMPRQDGQSCEGLATRLTRHRCRGCSMQAAPHVGVMGCHGLLLLVCNASVLLRSCNGLIRLDVLLRSHTVRTH